ncbi:MAG: NDP-hexose 4-ketoreductase [Verrucomicrobia bacterium GWF2_51_19]|nr:MAG: NDP-hexose 4-ketoreductase [Verrucomicrobia bacterium GWF2_51_19]
MGPLHNFTPRAQQVLALARKEASRLRQNYVGTEHLLMGLLELGQGVAVNVLHKMGLDIDTVHTAIEKYVSGSTNAPTPGTGEIPFTPRVKKVLALAAKEAKALHHSYIGTEHILLGLLREGEGVAARILKNLNVDIDVCRREILIELDPNYVADPEDYEEEEDEEEEGDLPPQYPPMIEPGNMPGGAPMTDRRAADSRTPALKSFGRDLTEKAARGELDPVIGRQKEIRRMIQILCRRTKNNPVLIGEAGVGKTAIVEGLAQSIIEGKVPDMLKDKRLMTLDLALMLAGTKYRGQFEERLKTVMDEIRKVKNVLLFIDELHTIVGAGSAEGAMDASNILKPALSRGEMQCIGATTISEYRKNIEKDGALDRRFQSITVEPPSIDEAILILKGLQERYEAHHNVHYTDEALEAAVKLSNRYIMGRYLPDKAIDVIDEAGSRMRIETMKAFPGEDKFDEEMKAVTDKKEKAIEKQDFEKAAKLRDQEKKLEDEQQKAVDKWKKTQKEERVNVTDEDIFRIVADWTGIPLSKMEEKEAKKLLSLEKTLQAEVIGQEEATIAIAKALRRSRADLKDPRRPIGSFMFLGPTGVGKTYLAKKLAEQVFGNQDAIIQVDMSEYMEKHAVSRLIGSPPGYIGHEEGGQLTESVRRKPYSVILFDEIEKAHPDVVQILLQVLEEGRLTDSLGRVIDFRNTILIMTSNVGADLLQREVSLGFGHGISAAQDFEKVKEQINEATKKVFKPEFLNRITDLIVFHSLELPQMHQIVDLELSKITKRLTERDILLEFKKEAKDFLVEKGYDKKYGARPLKRSIERYLEDPLAEAVLKGEITHKKPIKVGVAKDKQSLSFTESKKKESMVS